MNYFNSYSSHLFIIKRLMITTVVMSVIAILSLSLFSLIFATNAFIRPQPQPAYAQIFPGSLSGSFVGLNNNSPLFPNIGQSSPSFPTSSSLPSSPQSPGNTIPVCIDIAAHIYPTQTSGSPLQQPSCPYPLTQAQITIVPEQPGNGGIVCLFLSVQQSSSFPIQSPPQQQQLSPAQIPLGCVPSAYLSSILNTGNTSPSLPPSQFSSTGSNSQLAGLSPASGPLSNPVSSPLSLPFSPQSIQQQQPQSSTSPQSLFSPNTSLTGVFTPQITNEVPTGQITPTPPFNAQFPPSLLPNLGTVPTFPPMLL